MRPATHLLTHTSRRLRAVPLLLALALTTGLAGCGAPSAPPPVRDGAPAPENTYPAEPAPARYIDQLLADAADAIDRLQLTTPPHDNAYDRYQQILEIEPGNEAATVGLQRIVARYLDLAGDSFARGDGERTLRFLDRADTVLPGDPDVARLRARLTARLESRQQAEAVTTAATVRLDPAAVGARQPSMHDELVAIGGRAKAAGQRLIITARNDAEGRWMYQQLNAAPGPRLRAELRIGSAPGVTLQQLPR